VAEHRAAFQADHRVAFQAMGGPGRITFEPAGPAATRAQDAAAARAQAELQRIEAKYSRYRADSLLSRLNAGAGQGQPVRVDDETADLLDAAARLHLASDGRFDISTGALRRVWNFREPALPSAAALQAALARVGWQRVRWQRPWLQLTVPGLELDFGGLCKEYAVDRAATLLEAAGVGAAIVNLAGDLRAVGRRADGRPWRLGIVHPRRPGEALAELSLFSGALATSGDYERGFDWQGRRYSHLLDARSGWPVADWQAASVLAPLCSAAGMLATVAMLSGPEAPALLQGEAVEHLLVDAQGGVRATPAFALAEGRHGARVGHDVPGAATAPQSAAPAPRKPPCPPSTTTPTATSPSRAARA
jgi:thiamine biosynthesis lipoprotein